MTTPIPRSPGPKRPPIDPDLPPSISGHGKQSPLLEKHSYRNHKRATMTLRQVQRVSKQAAIASKRKIWDSNDASIDAAQQAVDHWENAYNAFRGLLVASAHSAQQLYRAAKAGANGLEHGLLVPVRDWILLPTFSGVERAAGETVGFLQSPQAAQAADASLDIVRMVPFVGDSVLAPVLVKSAELAKAAWHVAQYPIPSKAAVRDSVDFAMTGTKWAITTTAREIYFYAKIVDANITRTLMHTQWKVLGTGPYGSLDKMNKGEVIDHLCERYFSLGDMIHRYELAAHIRAHNPKLYHDLVLTGLLRDRGGDLTEDDEWLSPCPSYRSLDKPFLLSMEGNESEEEESEITSLWFRLPSQNGKRPGRDTPWVLIPEGHKLEDRYTEVVIRNKSDSEKPKAEHDSDAKFKAIDPETERVEDTAKAPFPQQQRYPTIAQWYDADMENDVLIDQKRHAVSFIQSDPDFNIPVDSMLLPPPLKMIMRPTMWRFHGPGDEVRRAVWFLDTKRHGLQPYSEASAAVLEDAFLFLKWKSATQVAKKGNDLDGDILTVEVLGPNGAGTQLVQFRSLAQVTAIQKNIGGAISLFKRRVYRGAHAFEESIIEDTSESKDLMVESEEIPDPSKILRGSPIKKGKTIGSSSQNDVAEVKKQDSSEVDIKDEVSSVVTIESEMISLPLKPDEDEQENKTHHEPDCDNVPIAIVEKDPASILAAPRPLVSCCSDEENDSGDVAANHLVLVVHGIGEMLRSIDLFGMSLPNLNSIVDCCRFLRTHHAQIHSLQTAEMDRSNEQNNDRVEYLPVEWHEAFAIQSQRKAQPDIEPVLSQRRSRYSNTTMHDISLRTIPQMRSFANDTLLDVLYFMSPEHHGIIIDIVTSELNFVVQKFRYLTGFEGNISIIGHSLGSVISWDILANQIPKSSTHEETFEPPSPFQTLYSHSPAISPTFSNFDATPSSPLVATRGESSSESSATPDGPESSTPPQEEFSRYPQLSFEVQNAFMLGSPIPVFLMIRNKHRPLSENFFLTGCQRVFNVFHPYDPVAYRLEPLLDPRNADIEPRIITHWNGGFRVHYQTKLLWKKLVDETLKTQQNVVNAVEAQMAGLGLLDGATDVMLDDDEELSEISTDENRLDYVNCGKLNQGYRIDYMLQEKEIENANEYVAALAAHSSYWMEKDFSLFVARQIHRGRNDAMRMQSGETQSAITPVDSVDL